MRTQVFGLHDQYAVEEEEHLLSKNLMAEIELVSV